MQHDYSTVNAEEQRASIAKVVDFTRERNGRNPSSGTLPGGTLGGTQPDGGRAQKQKTGGEHLSNRLVFSYILRAGHGIRTLDVHLGKTVECRFSLLLVTTNP